MANVYHVEILTRDGPLGETRYEASSFGAALRSVILNRLFRRGGSVGETMTIRIERKS